MLAAIDRVQRRYGYSDEHVLDIPYARLFQLMSLTFKWEHEAQKQRYREHAIVPWRIESLVQSMFSDGKKELQLPSLKEYWDDIGIGDGSTIKEREGDMASTAAEALEHVYALFGVEKPEADTVTD